jgi:hypothetical protein
MKVRTQTNRQREMCANEFKRKREREREREREGKIGIWRQTDRHTERYK